MSSYVVSENIRRFRALLAGELDPERRRTVEDLLAEEESRLAAFLAAEATAKSDRHPNP